MPQQKWYSINMDKLYSILNEETELTSSRKEIKEHNVKKLDINNNNNNNKKIIIKKRYGSKI